MWSGPPGGVLAVSHMSLRCFDHHFNSLVERQQYCGEIKTDLGQNLGPFFFSFFFFNYQVVHLFDAIKLA